MGNRFWAMTCSWRKKVTFVGVCKSKTETDLHLDRIKIAFLSLCDCSFSVRVRINPTLAAPCHDTYCCSHVLLHSYKHWCWTGDVCAASWQWSINRNMLTLGHQEWFFPHSYHPEFEVITLLAGCISENGEVRATLGLLSLLRHASRLGTPADLRVLHVV